MGHFSVSRSSYPITEYDAGAGRVLQTHPTHVAPWNHTFHDPGGYFYLSAFLEPLTADPASPEAGRITNKLTILGNLKIDIEEDAKYSNNLTRDSPMKPHYAELDPLGGAVSRALLLNMPVFRHDVGSFVFQRVDVPLIGD
ncbi:hypothetical protein PCH_Pc18g01440 [Penicillium rubens Wisconsin 54-1255]|uniref:Uncharacterized protein n=1 Tax=Penicillium rubens (strain ATCC 28089 / DSM 1075 / NRRL 1951 / Wisconsin 54-1255) TaxID=500485 RepID=B6HCE5_PENRW|nr:hypothetical protein PCH_Pc18g01440 [Penicillium rubens Wisconsin 54-1255]